MTDGQSQGPRPEPQSVERTGGGGKPWTVEIDVYLISDDDPSSPVFEVVSCLPAYEKDGEKYLVFENNCRPGFDIHFHLHDRTGKGYRFPRHENDAVWSKIGTDCPRSEEHAVLEPRRVVEPDGTMLVVHNRNDKKDGNPIGQFRYTLNVSTTGRSPYLPLDPGGDDRNGGSTFR